MIPAWHAFLEESAAPGWAEPPPPDSVGLDYLGTLQANLAMLGVLTQGMNNVVTSARQHAVIAWACWRYRENLRAAGRHDADPDEWRAMLDAVESIQLAGHVRLGEELGRDNVGFGAGSAGELFDGQRVRLRFPDYDRNHQTSIMAAVNYGPSAKDIALHFITGAGGVWVPTTGRGEALARHLDPLLRRSASYGRLARLPLPGSIPVDEALDLARSGLSEGPALAPRPERASYVEALFDLDQQPVSDLRRRSLALFLEVVGALDHADGVDAHDVRRVLLAGRLPDDPLWRPPSHLQETARLWRILQVRQLQRFCLETWLYLAECWMDLERTAPAMVTRALAASAQDPVGELVRGDAAHALSGFIDDIANGDLSAWANTDHPRDPWKLVWDEVGRAVRAKDTDRTAVAAIVLTLAVTALVDVVEVSGALEERFLTEGARLRISLATWQRWWRRRAEEPFDRVLAEMLSELVLQQHVAVAVSRFDNDKRRLRFCNDKRGWELLPGTLPAEPRLTPDRIPALTSLLGDLGLLHATPEGRWRLADSGRAVLDRVQAACIDHDSRAGAAR